MCQNSMWKLDQGKDRQACNKLSLILPCSEMWRAAGWGRCRIWYPPEGCLWPRRRRRAPRPTASSSPRGRTCRRRLTKKQVYVALKLRTYFILTIYISRQIYTSCFTHASTVLHCVLEVVMLISGIKIITSKIQGENRMRCGKSTLDNFFLKNQLKN